MSKHDEVNCFLRRVTSDIKLNPFHVSMCTALCSAWIANELNDRFNISRKVLMKASRIKSTATYHRIIADLVELGYFRYTPSFHPRKGSEIEISSFCSKGS